MEYSSSSLFSNPKQSHLGIQHLQGSIKASREAKHVTPLLLLISPAFDRFKEKSIELQSLFAAFIRRIDDVRK